jgi:hypothetical protein
MSTGDRALFMKMLIQLQERKTAFEKDFNDLAGKVELQHDGGVAISAPAPTNTPPSQQRRNNIYARPVLTPKCSASAC